MKLLTALFIVAVFSLAAWAQTAAEIKTEGAGFREKPAGNGRVIRRLDKGEIVDLIKPQEVSGWYQVRHRGTAGWIHKSDLTISRSGGAGFGTGAGDGTVGPPVLQTKQEVPAVRPVKDVWRFAASTETAEYQINDAHMKRSGNVVDFRVREIDKRSITKTSLSRYEINCAGNTYRLLGISGYGPEGEELETKTNPAGTTKFLPLKSGSHLDTIREKICGETLKAVRSPNAGTNGPASGLKLISRPKPEYTNAARLNNVTGRVLLRVQFLSSGKIGRIEVVEGLPHGLTGKAIEATRQIRFEPARRNGKPYTVTKIVAWDFTIY